MPLFKVDDDGKLPQSLKLIVIYIFADGANSEVCLALYRKSLKSKEMDHDGTHFDGQYPHVFVTLGASVSPLINAVILPK